MKEYHGIGEILWELRREILRNKQRAKKEQRKNVGHNLLQQESSNDDIDYGILEIGSLQLMNFNGTGNQDVDLEENYGSKDRFLKQSIPMVDLLS